MKKILIFISFIILVSCNDHSTIEISREEYNKITKNENQYPKYIGEFSTNPGEWGADKSIFIVVIDSCEYIGSLRRVASDVITHKGNCKFCIYRNKL